MWTIASTEEPDIRIKRGSHPRTVMAGLDPATPMSVPRWHRKGASTPLAAENSTALGRSLPPFYPTTPIHLSPSNTSPATISVPNTRNV